MTRVIRRGVEAGDAAAMEVTPAAPDDPFLAFRRDHARVLGSLDALEASALVGGGPLDERPLRELVALLERQFATHMAAEDAVLYPALRTAFPEVGGTIDPLLADHAELRATLAALGELLALSPGRARDEQLVVLARDFTDLLRLHIRKEESLVLDVASRVLSHAEIAAMADGLVAFRREPDDPRAPRGR